MDIIRRKANTEYIVLQKAASKTGYASDYIGWLIRTGKVKGKRAYTQTSWQVETEELIKYCQKQKNLETRDFSFFKKKYLSLKEAAEISGYASDYIGWLIRTGKVKGKRAYTGISWQTTEEAIKNYQKRKTKTKGKIFFDFPSYIKSIHLVPESGNKVFGFGWSLSLTALIIFFLVSGFAPIKFLHNSLISAITERETKTINYYPAVSYGDWQNLDNVQELPEIGPSGDINSFNENNSAVYKTGPLALIIEGFVVQEELGEKEPIIIEEEVKKIIEEEITEEETKEKEEATTTETETAAAEEEAEEEEEEEEATTTTAAAAAEVEGVKETEELEIIPEEVQENEIPETEEEIFNPELQTSLFETFKRFFGFKAYAQENTFSAKIKISFAIGEKESDIQIIENQEIEPVPSESEPTGFWNKVKNFLVVKAEEGRVENGSLPAEETITAEATTTEPILEETITTEEATTTETTTTPEITERPTTEASLPDLDTRIIIWWSLDGENWQQLVTISDYPLSNFLNGGYFEYEASFLKDFEDVKNLKIKFEGVVGSETNIVAYLDSVWVEIEYKEEKEEEEEFELRAIKNDWRADETPEFEVVPKGERTQENIIESLIAKVSSIFEEEPKVEATLIGPNREESLLQEGEDFSSETHSPTRIRVFKQEGFRPGLHRLKIEYEKNGKVYNLETEFTWGVLAINTNKSIYLPDETAYLQMAVLKEDGHTICDANLKLEVISPNGEPFSVPVQKSGECRPNNVTGVPDYFAYYQVKESGIYEMKLTNLDNGYEITDSFEVRDSVPFDIERIGPTRIYPLAAYEMVLKINTNEDFQGEVREFIPNSFVINSETSLNIQNSNEEKIIVWEVNWKAGETHELKYTFDAPDISPYLYLVGPLKIGDFQEIRQWQIASDASTEDFNIQRRCEKPAAGIGTVTLTAGTGYTAPANNTKAFIRLVSTRLSGMGPLTTGATKEADDVTWYISDPDFAGGSVSFTRAGTAINARLCWEIIEYIGLGGGTNEMIVRGVGAVTYTSTGLTVDGGAVSGIVNDNDVVVFITGQNSVETVNQGEVGAGLSTAEWVAASDIPRFTRGTHNSDANRISYAVVEFIGSNWGVERIQHQFTLAGTTETENITDVGDTSRAFFHAQFRGTTVAGLDEYGAEMWLSSTGQASFLMESGANTPSDKYGVIWIVRNSNIISETKMNVQHLNGTRNIADISEGAANEEDEWSVTITEISATTTASVMGESGRSAGAGTTWPRGWISLYLNSTTTVKLYHADDGQQQNYRFQVVEWPKSVSGPLTSQLHYRWRDDTTDLNTSGGWFTVEDSNTIGNITKNNTYRLRIEVANVGTQAESAARTYELQWGDRSGKTSCSQVTTWTGIANASDEFDMVDTTNIDPDGESTSPALLANNESYTYVTGEGRDTADTTGSIGPLTNSYYTELEYSFKATDDAVTGRTYCFRLYDTTAGAALDFYQYPRLTISSVLIVGTTVMEWGTQSNVSDDGWSTVNFSDTFTSPVFICSVQYNANIGNESDADADSVVCRVQNVGSNSAQVILQEPGAPGSLTQTETIHWLVMEAGTYNTDDIKMEAFTYTSTVTDYKNSYVGESQSYGQSYTEPVVLGQVMTYADSLWSVFWAGGSSGGNTSLLPSPSVLYTGKHVGEDPTTARNNETIGVIVIEEMHGTLGTIEFEAGIQGQTIERIDDSPNDTYTFNESFGSAPTVAVVAQAGISGGDGPHPVLYGSSPLTTGTINPTIMEDEILDTEQTGNTEAVSYMVFVSAGSYAINQSALDQTTYRFYQNADSVQPGSALAGENTPINDVADNDIIRIRLALQVGLNNLATSTQSFKLRYASTTDICTSSLNWSDVGQIASSTIWRGYDNSTPADGAQITSSLLNSQSNALETYEEENNSALNPAMIPKGTRGEWDYVVQNDGATVGTNYCFRMVLSDGSVMQYTNYPKLTTAAAAGITISGTVYTDEGVTGIGFGKSVRLKVNGSGDTYTASTTATSSYSISTVTIGAAGDVITVFLDNGSEKAVTITRASSTSANITGLDLYQNRIIVRHEDSGPITISDLDKYDSGEDDDILFTAASSTGTLTASSTSEFFVWSATTTFGAWGTGGVGGTTTLADLDIRGTFTATSTQTISVSGNWDATTTATFNSASSTVEFTATSGKFIRTNGKPFWNLTFNGSGGGWTLQDALDVNNNLNLTAGTLIASSQNINIAGDLTLASGGYFTKGTGTTTFDGAGTNTWADNNATKQDMGIVVIDGSSKTINLGSDVKTTKLTIGLDDTFGAGSYTFTITGLGTGASRPFLINSGGSFNASTSLTEFTATSTTDIESTTYYNLELNQTSTTFQLYNNVTITNDINIAAGTLDVTASNYNLVIGGNWTNSGTFVAQQGTVTFDGSSIGKTIDSGGIGGNKAFYDIDFDNASGGWTFSTSTTVADNFTITAGTATSTSGILYVGGDWYISSTAATFKHNSGTVLFNATTTGKTITDGGWPFYLLTFNGGNGEWLYQDSTSTAPATTTVQAGTPTFLNAKTGAVSVTGGELLVDWYLGVHVIDKDYPTYDIDTSDNDITVSSTAATVWKWDGSNWLGPYNSTTTGSLSNGKIPHPATTTAGAIKIREYSKTDTTTTFYKYNLEIDSQSGFDPYDYYTDYEGKYITSTLSPEENEDRVISQDWHRSVISLMNEPYTCSGGEGDQCINQPPTNGSWYIGMSSVLEFTVTPDEVNLILNLDNYFTATTSITLSATTSHPNGFIVKAHMQDTEGELTTSGAEKIERFPHNNDSPGAWDNICNASSTQCGFGYTTNDNTLGTPNPARFTDPNFCGATGDYCWAGFATSSQSTDPVATGGTGGESYFITLKTSVKSIQLPDSYSGTIYFICTVDY